MAEKRTSMSKAIFPGKVQIRKKEECKKEAIREQ
jgi:hypothetical protein